MKSIFALSIFLLIFIVTKAQNDPYEKMEVAIQIYKKKPNYLFVQTNPASNNYRDSILILLPNNDSVIAFIPIHTTYGFVNLYGITNNESVLIKKQEGDFSDFLEFILFKQNYTAYKLEYIGCQSHSFVYIFLTN